MISRTVDGVHDRLDREAVERVLRRAHSIDQQSPGSDSGGIEPSALIDAATEVGIDPNAVRDSLAVERFVGPDAGVRRFDCVAGPDRIVVERELHMTVDEAIDGIEAWLTTVYRMTCDRRQVGVVFARRRTDTVAQLSRSFDGVRGEGRLDVTEVVAEAVPRIVGSSPLDPLCVVRVSIDRSTSRNVRLGGGGAVGAMGVAGGGATALATQVVVWAPAIAVPLMVGGFLIARTGRSDANRVELEVERLLSRVDRGEQAVGLIGRFTRRAREAVVGPKAGAGRSKWRPSSR